MTATMPQTPDQRSALIAVEQGVYSGPQPKIPENEIARDAPETIANSVPLLTRKRGMMGVEDWPEPEPLPTALPAVAAFDLALLPDALRPWIADVSDRMQCPPDFAAVGAMVALGSVIGRQVAVRPKAKDDWQEFANLWGVVVGSPGVLKTPALQEAMRPLRKLEAAAAREHEAALGEWRANTERDRVLLNASRDKAKKAALKGLEFDASSLVGPDRETEPPQRRYIVNDTSIESLGEVLIGNPNGVLAYRDELVGLLKSMEREGMEGARAFYLSAYSGKEAHTFDRIGRGLNRRIEACCVALLGSIQPAAFGEYLRQAVQSGGGDGLLARFSLLTWPDVSNDWRVVDRVPDAAARARAVAVFERLDRIDPAEVGADGSEGSPPFLRFGPDAREVFLSWMLDFERQQRSGDEHPALVAHLAKYRKLVPALALVSHLADGGRGPVGEEAVVRALGWAEYLETHARRAYASLQRGGVDAASALLSRLRRGHVEDGFASRDVYRKGWGALPDARTVDAAAAVLVEHGYLRPEPIPTRDAGGRPSVRFRINPAAKR